MPRVELVTIIHAAPERCFDLARSIDFHRLSMKGTNEEALAGVTSGLIGKDGQVTWRARHFGIAQTLTSKITRFEYPAYFRGEMIKGPFRTIVHDHLFEAAGDSTIMSDTFVFESPGGFIGDVFSGVILERYLRGLLLKRNALIKEAAESELWRQLLNKNRYENACSGRMD